MELESQARYDEPQIGVTSVDFILGNGTPPKKISSEVTSWSDLQSSVAAVRVYPTG